MNFSSRIFMSANCEVSSSGKSFIVQRKVLRAFGEADVIDFFASLLRRNRFGCRFSNRLPIDSPVRHFCARVLNAEVEPLRMTIRVHIRPQVQFVVVLCDFDDACQISRLEARLEDEIVGIERVRLRRQQILGASDAGS